MARDKTTARKGVSLAKGPVGILGILGILYGLSALLLKSHGFALHVPHGAVHGKKWIGLEVNGWSDLLFIAAGLALLLAAPLHWGAKSMSLLVGWVMIAAAVIAYVRKDGVFGIFAANHLTELVWAAAGVLLLVLALLPRVGGRSGQDVPEQTGAVERGPEHRNTGKTTAAAGSGSEARRGRLIRPRRTAGDEPRSRPLRGAQDAGTQERSPQAGAQGNDDHQTR